MCDHLNENLCGEREKIFCCNLLLKIIILNISQLTGNIRPRMEKQKAPIRPINGAIVGTDTAKTTAAVTKTVLKIKFGN